MSVLDTFRLNGKVALVTGGSRGLGLQIAEALGEAGASVAITARRAPGLDEAVQHLSSRDILVMSSPCDISHNDQVESAVQAVLDRFGHIDILVNNAGATWGAPFAQLPFDAWDKVIRTNHKRQQRTRFSLTGVEAHRRKSRPDDRRRARQSNSKKLQCLCSAVDSFVQVCLVE
jgi:NAD(P)-dependent dehydrogenase (short-subunit alcohol dehydrogenase family)